MSYTTIGFLFGNMMCPECGEPVITSAHVCTDFAKLRKTVAEGYAAALAARCTPEKAMPPLTEKSSLLHEVARLAIAEVERAVQKFPTWPTDPFHALAVVGEEFGELTQSVLQHTYEPKKCVTLDDIRSEAIQLAAMTLRFIVSLPQYTYSPSDQHTQREAQAAISHNSMPQRDDT